MRIVPEEDDAVLGDAQVDLDGVGPTLVQGRPEEAVPEKLFQFSSRKEARLSSRILFSKKRFKLVPENQFK